MEKKFKWLPAYNEETYDEIWDKDSEKSYSEFEEICDLLNEQDEKIKELEEWVQAKDILINSYISIVGTLDNAKQLKQSQNQTAIEVLEELKEFCEESRDELIDRELNDYHVKDLNDLDNRLQKDHELAVTKKALELACKELKSRVGACRYCRCKDDDICGELHNCSSAIKEWAIDKAKEMLKDEKGM